MSLRVLDQRANVKCYLGINWLVVSAPTGYYYEPGQWEK